MNISKILKEIKKEKKLTFQKMAEMSGLEKRSIQNWIFGVCYPTLDKLEILLTAIGYEIKISEILNCTVDDLIKEQKEVV